MKHGHSEAANAASSQDNSIARSAGMSEGAHAEGRYVLECFDKDGKLKWAETIDNVVTTEGRNAALNHFLKGSAYTATQALGLIEATGYGFAGANGSGVAATNIAASITASGGASPPNGWNEAPSSVAATRGTPSFGTPSAGSLATSAAVSFSILASATIKGAFLMLRSLAGVAPTTAVGNTSGALYSAGLFTGGDRAVANGDTLNVSYTASL